MKGYRAETFGELNADDYDAFNDPGTTPESVELLAELAAGGRVLELAIGTGRVALPLAARGLAVHGIDASREMIDPVTQLVQYQYIRTTRDGTRLLPLPMRYAWPSEIDLMARLAGLELRNRWGGWDRSPFTATSRMHVSVYGWPKRPSEHRG